MTETIYQRLGVRVVINAWGTMTSLGGSLMHPLVLRAMEEASHGYVEIPTLQQVAARRVAMLLEAPAACITAGAAAGLAVAAAACVAGTDPVRVAQLPDTTGLPNRVLILAAHRFLYDRAVEVSGARLVEVGQPAAVTRDQAAGALDGRVAMILYAAQAESVPGSLPLHVLADLARDHGVPVLVDAAAELPPRSNIPRYLAEGASLVVVSGGKEIRGPQSSGLILGEPGLIEACDANNYPNMGIGRPMKTDKETIAGLLAAVELFCAKDYEEIAREWEAMLGEILAGLPPRDGVSVRRVLPMVPDIQPFGIPRIYITSESLPARRIQQMLMARGRPIAVGLSPDRREVAINPQCLAASEIPDLVAGLREVLFERPRPDAGAAT